MITRFAVGALVQIVQDSAGASCPDVWQHQMTSYIKSKNHSSGALACKIL